MAIDPVTGAALIQGGFGLLGSLFGGKKKAPRNEFSEAQLDALRKAQGVIANLSLRDRNQKILENYSKQINRQVDRAISAQNASDFSRNDQPLVDSERGVARGVIARSGAEAVANLGANLEANIDSEQLGLYEQLAAMGGAGFGNRDTQIQRDIQAQSSYDQGLAGLADLLTRSMKPKASRSAGSQSEPPSFSPYYGPGATQSNAFGEPIYRPLNR
jgi:hypothetical protein